MNEIAPLRESFRQAMRGVASFVAIITGGSASGRFGMTATAVTSLSFDPPSLLVCVDRGSRFHSQIARWDRYCVNILDAQHSGLSRVFAEAPADQRFGSGAWREDENGSPYLVDAQANIFCATSRIVDFGSHSVFFGLVENVINAGTIDPLVYSNGGYARCVPLKH